MERHLLIYKKLQIADKPFGRAEFHNLLNHKALRNEY